jgi:hypothetical protein
MMEISDQDRFNELLYYTLGHPDMSYFIHQHVVDAYAAQKADGKTKPITIWFSLVGLHLFIDKNYSGRQVQLAHLKLSKNKKSIPTFNLPKRRGMITISNVLAKKPGLERDLMIKKWCISVWKAYKDSHDTVANLVKIELGK